MSIRFASLCCVAVAGLALCVPGCEPKMNLAAEHEEAASARSPLTGQPAPDFTLHDQDDKPVTLSKQQGKWVVLYFYPKDDTPGCTCQATEFTRLIGEMRDMNAEILGISADSSETHQVFIEKYNLGLTLLSDRDHKVMDQYGVWMETTVNGKAYGRTVRTTFVIDPKGVIRRVWPEVIPEGHAERVKQWLAKLQAAQK
jgi:thioredoxin-dependent peroxiredoxin